MSQSAYIQLCEKHLPEIQERIAECQAQCPDPEYRGQISMRIYSGRQALNWIFICSLHPYWETDKLIEHIGYLAFRYQYQGIWEEVQEYLEDLPKDSKEFLTKYLENHSPNEFFGNFIKEVKYELRKLKYKSDRQYGNSRKKIKYPRSRREYCDKGTLRPSSEDHGIAPSKQKIDRRREISHPLLSEKSKIELSKNTGGATSSGKGENHDRSRKTS